MFEFPDEWWTDAGATDFTPSGQSYTSTTETKPSEVLLPLLEIAPVLRNPTVTRDSNGFRRQGGVDGGLGGMIDVLRAIVNGIPLPPLDVRRVSKTSSEAFGYVIADGFHRFYASYAIGYTHIPCLIKPDGLISGQLNHEF
jgi:hypothetical protein